MKEYYVYAHRDKNTNEVLYVGKGSNKRAYIFSNRPYKKEQVDIIILPMRYIDEKKAYEVEEIVTEYYKSIGQCRYNYRLGDNRTGVNNPIYGVGIKGFMTDEEIEQWRKNISKATKGENNPFYGKKHTEDSKKKISEHHYDCSGVNNSQAKIYRVITPEGVEVVIKTRKKIIEYFNEEITEAIIKSIIKKGKPYHTHYSKYKKFNGLRIIPLN